MAQTNLTSESEKIREILCAPEPTDELRDISFNDPDFDEEAERDFVQSWLDAEI